MRIYLILITLFTAIIVCAACSKNSNPTMPILHNNEFSEQGTNVHSLSPTRGVFGVWKVFVDTINMKAEIIPARNAQAIGDIFDADLSQFLTVSPCANCLAITSVLIDGYENLHLTVRMKHPFGNIATRPDLHGFDIRGIFVLSSETIDSNIKVMLPSSVEEDASYSKWLLNADGYTSHFDELTSDPRYFIGGADVPGNLNPFLRFFEDYATPTFDPYAPDGHNVMPVGSGNYNRTAVFKKFQIGQPFEFYIVADVAYGQSAVLANRTNPQYYLPAFHRTESWRAEYWIENNILNRHDTGSTADIVVQVFDWQQGATVDPAYPNPSNLSGIPEKSDVLRLELSMPELQSDPIIVTTPEAGSGTPTDPLRYRFTVTNSNDHETHLTSGLLAIRDDLYGQPSPNGRMPIPTSPAGFPYETIDILDYTLYLPIHVNITNGILSTEKISSAYTNNEFTIPIEDQFAQQNIVSGYRTTLHPSFYMDPSNKEFQYRWDYNYDGMTFDVDGSGLPSPEIEYSTPGKKNPALRVRTNSVPPKEYIYQFPVYAEGLAYNNQLLSPSANRTTTDKNRNYSMWVTDTYVYLVYTSEIGSQRDIWLAIADRAGIITTHQVTNDANPDYNPSIRVITSGTHAGVYVAYSSYDGSNSFVYATYGNLDGTGFAPSNIKRVSTAGIALELTPIIYLNGLDLCVYYLNFGIFVGYIYGSHSTDYGVTWNDDGWLVNNGSTEQLNPAVCYGGFNNMCLIWEDWINSTDRGADLWMAESSNGYTFTNIRNISHFQDKTHEIYPAADYSSGLAIISYLAYPDGSTTRNVHLKFVNVYFLNESMVDYEIEEGAGGNLIHTQPAISNAGLGHHIVSFGSYNTSSQNLTAYVVDVFQHEYTGRMYEHTLYESSIGTIGSTTFANELYPAVGTYKPQMNILEVFAAFRNYSTGSYTSPVEPNMTFGEVNMMYIIQESEYSL